MRRGLVLGGGGILGAAWMLGALDAVADVTGLDPRDFDVIVGTSAGAFLAAMLGSGVAVPDLFDRQLGVPVVRTPADTAKPDDPLEAAQETAFAPVEAVRPARGPLRPGSPRLLGQLARHPSRVNPRTLIAAGLPPGRRSLDHVIATIDEVTPPGGWCAREGVLVTGFDLDAGTRALFGGPGTPYLPDVRLGDAVRASCAIPGWFEPVSSGERRFVDGGSWSVSNADVLVGHRLDEVVVLAPMVSFDPAPLRRPATAMARLDRAWRRAATGRLVAEVASVRADGAVVRVLGPSRADLAVIGSNLMDARRRAAVLDMSRRTSRVALRDPRDPTESARHRAR